MRSRKVITIDIVTVSLEKKINPMGVSSVIVRNEVNKVWRGDSVKFIKGRKDFGRSENTEE